MPTGATWNYNFINALSLILTFWNWTASVDRGKKSRMLKPKLEN